jgi:lipopolysaccharide/colanic/teichoic acid biosynthesis glycosyltransferase
MYLRVKRFFDVVFAATALVILSPVLLPIVLMLAVTGEREVFYRQLRVGYRNRDFGIWKFATMLKNSPNMGSKDLTLRNDPRVTVVGRFLRITKINELPQLLNILSGDMSFVGPRPLMRSGFDRYAPHFQDKVYQVHPGLTGIGSIVFRDEELIITDSGLNPEDAYRNIIQPYKGALEIWYQQRQGFFTDLSILFLTAWYVLFPNSKLVHRIFSDLPKR